MYIEYGYVKQKYAIDDWQKYYYSEVHLIGNNGKRLMLYRIDCDDQSDRGLGGYAIKTALKCAEQAQEFYGCDVRLAVDGFVR